MASTNPGQEKPSSPILPEGISIQFKQQLKSFRLTHNTSKGKGDVTLGGLRKQQNVDDEGKKKQVALGKPIMVHLGANMSDEAAKALSQNYGNLPEILTGMGRENLQNAKQAFIEKATRAKKQLESQYGSRPIPHLEIQDMDRRVNLLAFEAIEVVVTLFSVTKDRVNDSSTMRQSDGLYVTSKVVRRITINNKGLSEQEMKSLASKVTGPSTVKEERPIYYRSSLVKIDKKGSQKVTLSVIPEDSKVDGRKTVNLNDSGALSGSANEYN